MELPVSEPTPRRPVPPPPAPAPVRGVPRRTHGGLAEPPAFRAPPLRAPTICANCSGAVATTAPPLCWGCGRPLCSDCYWRHGLTPTAHRCTNCLARQSEDAVAISGGRRVSPVGFSGRT